MAKIEKAFLDYIGTEPNYPPTPGAIRQRIPAEPKPEIEKAKPPCGCTAEALIAIAGAECEHGYSWGTGFLRNALKGACEPKDAAEVSERRAELKRQAEELSQ